MMFFSKKISGMFLKKIYIIWIVGIMNSKKIPALHRAAQVL